MDRLAKVLPFGRGSSRPSYRAMLSYVFDYGIIVALAIVYGALDRLIQPFNQHFSLTNISLQYPYAIKERIPIFWALIISCVAPAIIIAIYTLFIDGLFSHRRNVSGGKRWTFRQRLWELNCGILGLLLAQGAAFVITGSLKNLIGKPRPDLISRCRPQAGAADRQPFGLSSSLICSQTDASIMQDGFRSFPSGHSSASFAGLTYLSLYLAGKLHLLDQRGEVWKTVVVLTPTVAASCIAASRIMDARHHPFDVLFGSALGILCAWGAYRQYFPPLSHSWEKGRAYPMRTWGNGPMRRPDGYTMGSDGKFYNTAAAATTSTAPAHDRTADVLLSHDAEDNYPQRQAEYGMEPMRAPRHHFPPSAVDDTDSDYDQVRIKTGAFVQQGSIPSPSVRTPVSAGTGSGGNTFRDQLSRNETLRGGLNDEEDLGYRRGLNAPERI